MNANFWRGPPSEIQPLIDWLLARRPKNQSGWPVDGVTEFAIRELACSAKTPLREGLVMDALNEMRAAELSSLEGFENTVEALKQKRGRSGKQAAQWSFFIPVLIALDAPTTARLKIQMLGKEFRFSSRAVVEGRLGRKTIREVLLGWEPEELPAWFLRCSQEGADWHGAWEEIGAAFDALRGLIEFVTGFGTLRISTDQQPRARVPHPRWLLYTRQGEPLGFARFIIEEYRPTRLLAMTSERLRFMKTFGRALANVPEANSTLSVIADSLRLYSQAMDARFSYACFLGLWQAAEVISLSEYTAGKTEEVCRRIAWHGTKSGFPGSGFKYVLNELAARRNEVVHRGIHKVDDDDVNVMKRICEIAMRWLFREAKRLPTKSHLNAFYQLRTSGVEVVKAYSEASRYITRQRPAP